MLENARKDHQLAVTLPNRVAREPQGKTAELSDSFRLIDMSLGAPTRVEHGSMASSRGQLNALRESNEWTPVTCLVFVAYVLRLNVMVSVVQEAAGDGTVCVQITT